MQNILSYIICYANILMFVCMEEIEIVDTCVCTRGNRECWYMCMYGGNRDCWYMCMYGGNRDCWYMCMYGGNRDCWYMCMYQ